MSILLLLANMPASGPLGGGWSMWDIGCCCTELNVCGCLVADNYSSDFSTALDEHWTLTSIFEEFPRIVSSQLWASDWTPFNFRDIEASSAMFRCLVLPDMLDKQVYGQWDVVDMPHITAVSQRIIVVIETGTSGMTTCSSKYAIGIINRKVSNTRQYFIQQFDGTILYSQTLTGHGEGNTYRIEMDDAEIRFIENGVVDRTYTWVSGGLFDDAQTVNYQIELTASRDNLDNRYFAKCDNVAFGVEDIPP